MRALSPRFAALLAISAPLTLAAQPAMQPVNDLPNPYRTVEGWAKLPEGRSWGSTSAVAIDRRWTERVGRRTLWREQLRQLLPRPGSRVRSRTGISSGISARDS